MGPKTGSHSVSGHKGTTARAKGLQRVVSQGRRQGLLQLLLLDKEEHSLDQLEEQGEW